MVALEPTVSEAPLEDTFYLATDGEWLHWEQTVSEAPAEDTFCLATDGEWLHWSRQ